MIRRAFTLIELLVVMAISAILLALIAIPLVQSFNLTRAAQGLAESQSRARTLIEGIERDVANAALVHDNSGMNGALVVVVPGRDGNLEPVYLERAKLDLVPPAQGDPGPGGVLIDPDTGKVDPTLRAPKGQVNLPAAPGTTIVRYFVGLREPVLDTDGDGTPDRPGRYSNPFDGLLMARAGGADNLFVLYRAEVPVNATYFADPASINDPAFFAFVPGVDTNPDGSLTAAGQAKLPRVAAWKRAARVVSGISRFDMVSPIYNRANRQVTYDGNRPQLTSNIVFAPSRSSNEPATGMIPVRSGEESGNAIKVGPDVFETERGAWTSLTVRLWPSLLPDSFGATGPQAGDVRQPWSNGTPYLVARQRRDANGAELGLGIYLTPAPTGVADDLVGGTLMFDVDRYLAGRRAALPNAFTQAVNPGILTDALARNLFVPFAPEPKSGKVIASFPIEEVGAGLPAYPTGPALTPNNDPAVGAGTWTDTTFQSVNRRFNKLWTDFETLAPQLERARYVRRFVDLRLVPTGDGTPSPLDPVFGFPRAVIVPGSEVVVGPDQTPGPNFGQPVRYQRATQRPVGPNQYLINYVDQPEPDWASLGFTGLPASIYDPRYYDGGNLVSAVLQTPFRKGYLEFNSRLAEPLPDGNIQVSYRFQMTEPNDVLAVDYDSAQSIDIVLTLRHFPQTTLPEPQTFTLKGSARVRNFAR